MTLMKSSRAGLLALAFGILLGLFLSVASYDVSYAQAQAPAAAPAAAPATPPAPPPACANDPDPKKAVLEKCTPNSGDTAWMLTSVALVLMMTIPGLGLFYGGMVRKKNVGDTVMTSFAVTCLVTILYVVITYSLAFTPGSAFLGGTTRAFLQGIPERHLERYRHAKRPGGNDSRNCLPLLPVDIRHHHAGADCRRFCRADEVLRDAVVHWPMGDPCLRADRALGLGLGRLHVQRQ